MKCLSRICTGHHCQTCRDLDGGRAWRASLARSFNVSGLDFACPFGNPWGFVGKFGRPDKCPSATCAKCGEATTCGVNGATCGDPWKVDCFKRRLVNG